LLKSPVDVRNAMSECITSVGEARQESAVLFAQSIECNGQRDQPAIASNVHALHVAAQLGAANLRHYRVRQQRLEEALEAHQVRPVVWVRLQLCEKAAPKTVAPL